MLFKVCLNGFGFSRFGTWHVFVCAHSLRVLPYKLMCYVERVYVMHSFAETSSFCSLRLSATAFEYTGVIIEFKYWG